MKKTLLKSAVLLGIFGCTSANAIQLDGFLTAGFSVHDQKDNTYLDSITDELSFDNDSKFGLQVTSQVNDFTKVVGQLLASGKNDNYNLKIDWAYVDVKINDNFSMRGGKIKEPVFLISDYIEVGYAYPWIRPPEGVYGNNPITTIIGTEALVAGNFNGVTLSFQPYAGTNTEDVPGTGGAAQFKASNMFGALFAARANGFVFQLSGLSTDVNTSGLLPVVLPDPGLSGPVTFVNLEAEGTATLYSAGFSWDKNDSVGYAEYVTRDIEGSVEALFPDQTAYYFTVGHRFGDFMPHLTYANVESEPLESPGSNPGANQSSITAGLRYELGDGLAVKVELAQITPEVGNSGLFAAPLAVDKKANQFSMALDVIF